MLRACDNPHINRKCEPKGNTAIEEYLLSLIWNLVVCSLSSSVDPEVGGREGEQRREAVPLYGHVAKCETCGGKKTQLCLFAP